MPAFLGIWWGSFLWRMTMGLFSRLADRFDAANAAAAPAAPASAEICAPVTGELVVLESTADPAFCTRAMGDGVAIRPTDGRILAPVTGTLVAIFPTGHALAVADDASSAQVMVHVGIDTVKMQGQGFTTHAVQGQHVERGQLLVEVDLSAVEAAGFDPTTFCVICERAEGSTVREHEAGSVIAGQPVIWLSE